VFGCDVCQEACLFVHGKLLPSDPELVPATPRLRSGGVDPDSEPAVLRAFPPLPWFFKVGFKSWVRFSWGTAFCCAFTVMMRRNAAVALGNSADPRVALLLAE